MKLRRIQSALSSTEIRRRAYPNATNLALRLKTSNYAVLGVSNQQLINEYENQRAHDPCHPQQACGQAPLDSKRHGTRGKRTHPPEPSTFVKQIHNPLRKATIERAVPKVFAVITKSPTGLNTIQVGRRIRVQNIQKEVWQEERDFSDHSSTSTGDSTIHCEPLRLQ